MAEEFNGWNQNADPMEKDGNGNWTKTKMLSPGEVEYKFWVNGQWVTYPKKFKDLQELLWNYKQYRHNCCKMKSSWVCNTVYKY